MTITPDQARALLDGATPGPWHAVHYEDETRKLVPCGIVTEQPYCDEQGNPVGNVSVFDSGPATTEDGSLAAAAPDLAQTIAGMEWQWGVERAYRSGTETAVMWFSSEDDARQEIDNPNRQHGNPRLVRRLVGPVEEAE